MFFLGVVFMVLRSFLLACSVALVPVATAHAATPNEQATARIFNTVRTDPERLAMFMRQFPKGADLHNHLVGAIYAESYLKWAAQDGLCINTGNNRILPEACATPAKPDQVPATALSHNAQATNSLIDALSMRDFVPTAQDRSGHDHFFATFDKFGPAAERHSGDSLAEAMERAARDHVSYVEFMISPGLGGMIGAGFKHPLHNEDFSAAMDGLKAEIPALVAAARKETDTMEQQAHAVLHCGTAEARPGCAVTVRYLYQTLRVLPPQAVFSQLYAGYEVVKADPRFVGVNFVCPEDDLVAMRDYDLHMRMFHALNTVYPDVKLSLHAGEITPGQVPPEGLDHHIRAAVDEAGAKRIGHGVDVAWEKDPERLLQDMARKQVMVEINLTSNDIILNIKGKDHPFALYRRAGVPMALSTDDEGVSRGDLTQEYVRAATTWPLSYQEFKTLSRNGLTYAFVPGESLWQGTALNPSCQIEKSKSCTEFLANNEKARLQMALEEKFSHFEAETVKNPLFQN